MSVIDQTTDMIRRLFRIDHWRSAKQGGLLQQTAEGQDAVQGWGFWLDTLQDQFLWAATNRLAHRPAMPSALLGEFNLPPDTRFLRNKWQWLRTRATKKGLFDMANLIGYPYVSIYHPGSGGLGTFVDHSPYGTAISPLWASSAPSQLARYQTSNPAPWFTVIYWGLPSYPTLSQIGVQTVGNLAVLNIPQGQQQWQLAQDDRQILFQLSAWHQGALDKLAEVVFVMGMPANGLFYSDLTPTGTMSANVNYSVQPLWAQKIGYAI